MSRRIGRREGHEGLYDGWKRNNKPSPTQMNQKLESNEFRIQNSLEQGWSIHRRNRDGNETSFGKSSPQETGNGGSKSEDRRQLHVEKKERNESEDFCRHFGNERNAIKEERLKRGESSSNAQPQSQQARTIYTWNKTPERRLFQIIEIEDRENLKANQDQMNGKMQEEEEEKRVRIEDQQNYDKIGQWVKGQSNNGEWGSELARHQSKEEELWSFHYVPDEDKKYRHNRGYWGNVTEGEQSFQNGQCSIEPEGRPTSHQREEWKNFRDGKRYESHKSREHKRNKDYVAQRTERAERNYRNRGRNEEPVFYGNGIPRNQRFNGKNMKNNCAEKRQTRETFLRKKMAEGSHPIDSTNLQEAKMGKGDLGSQSSDKYSQLEDKCGEMKPKKEQHNERSQMNIRGVKWTPYCKEQIRNRLGRDESCVGESRNGQTLNLNAEENTEETGDKGENKQNNEIKYSGLRRERCLDFAVRNSLFNGETEVVHFGVGLERTNEGSQQGQKGEKNMNLKEDSALKIDSPNVESEKNEKDKIIVRSKASAGKETNVTEAKETNVTKTKETNVTETKETNVAEVKETNVTEVEKTRVYQKDLLLEWGIKLQNSLSFCHETKQKFFQHYEKWCPVREKTLELLETLSRKIFEDEKSYESYTQICKFMSNGGKALQCVMTVPIVQGIGVALASIGEIFGGIFKNRKTVKGFTKDSVDLFEKMREMEKDMNLFSVMERYRLKCEKQLKETGELLKQFHDTLNSQDFKNASNDLIFRKFVIEVTELDRRYRSFFLQVAEAFHKLCNTKWISPKSDKLCNAFCGSITMDPSILDTMRMLEWNLSSETNVSSGDVLHQGWEVLIDLMFNNDGESQSKTVPKIRRAIIVLTQEKEAFDRGITKLRGKRFSGQYLKRFPPN